MDPVLRDICEREDVRLRAFANNDADALEKILDKDLRYVHASGFVEDKAQIIGKVLSGERRYHRFDLLSREARQIGDLTLLFGQCDVEVDSDSGKKKTVINYTAVYVSAAEPRLVAWHSCRAP